MGQPNSEEKPLLPDQIREACSIAPNQTPGDLFNRECLRHQLNALDIKLALSMIRWLPSDRPTAEQVVERLAIGAEDVEPPRVEQPLARVAELTEQTKLVKAEPSSSHGSKCSGQASTRSEQEPNCCGIAGECNFQKCGCTGHCYQKGHRYRKGCQAMVCTEEAVQVVGPGQGQTFCVDCRCTVPSCARGKNGPEVCYSHSVQLGRLGDSLQCVFSLRKLLQQMLPCDIQVLED
jgi:hypothetical protein